MTLNLLQPQSSISAWQQPAVFGKEKINETHHIYRLSTYRNVRRPLSEGGREVSITLWKPEPDVLIHQALGKACEEASELATILARCLIQGLDQSEPVSGKPNRQALFEEIADLDAAVQWLRELIGDDYDESRADRKLNGFHRWQRMLEEDAALSGKGA
ncbi:hypothetical protein PH562_16530 [Rhizobium sp. CNPSo 4062]|uniref:hypothetical protein n=1 Tax=Rhizobium sp. CNPSo 4062 TaxID=3021410 RepID=UPI00254AE424|nr:hypothetical protein [Rhizobium sp. CNPSo 4062]MDK4703859.1 hypothetical protein [Rhizobium sp. CNPSo 4062]